MNIQVVFAVHQICCVLLLEVLQLYVFPLIRFIGHNRFCLSVHNAFNFTLFGAFVQKSSQNRKETTFVLSKERMKEVSIGIDILVHF